jgi:hypothetical protein
MRRHLVLVVVLVAVACGGPAADSRAPKALLSDALDDLKRSEGVTVDLSLRSTPESIVALASESGEPLDAGDAHRILDSSLRISSARTTETGRGAAEIVLTVAGTEGLELRTVDGVLYVRADVRHLLETFGGEPGAAEELAQQAAASGLEFVGPLLEGRWLALEGFDRVMARVGAEPTPTAEQQEVLDELAASLERSATVTSEGSDDAGEHLVASLSLREVYEDLRRLAEGLTPAPPGRLSSNTEVPEEEIEIDLWVDEGRLTQVEFDFLQLRAVGDVSIPDGVEELALRVGLADFSRAIAVPADAVPVDLREVVRGFLGRSAAGAGAATAVPAPR